MGQIKATVSISGTDDNGIVRGFTATGSMYVRNVVEGDFTATTSKSQLSIAVAAQDQFFKYIYVENYGSVDVAVGYIINGDTFSFCVPAGAALLTPCIETSAAFLGPSSVSVWTASSTAAIHYALFY